MNVLQKVPNMLNRVMNALAVSPPVRKKNCNKPALLFEIVNLQALYH